MQILLMVFTTRCFLQIFIVTHTNGDMSHFARVCIFNSDLRVTDLGCLTLNSESGALLPCLQTIWVSDRESRTVIGRTRHVTSPIWSHIDWLNGPKIRIVGLCFAELEMDKTAHLEFYLLLSGRSKHQFQ